MFEIFEQTSGLAILSSIRNSPSPARAGGSFYSLDCLNEPSAFLLSDNSGVNKLYKHKLDPHRMINCVVIFKESLLFFKSFDNLRFMYGHFSSIPSPHTFMIMVPELYCFVFERVVIAAQLLLDITRTWICRLIFFNEPEISDSGPPLGGLVRRILRPEKIHRPQPDLNPRTLDLEARTLPPRPPRPTWYIS